MPARCLILVLGLVWSAGLLARQGDESAGEAAATAARIGRYVEQYYSRAQSILAEEQVTLQPLTASMGFAGFPRRLVYELRLEWNPAAGEEEPATIVRELVSAGGPALGPPEQPDCLDPKAVSPEPLGFLLPERQEAFRFTLRGAAQIDGRMVMRLDYMPRTAEDPKVDWDGACGHIELPGRIRGRIWADPVTGEILRLDQHLVGIVDIPGRDEARRPDPRRWFTIERIDTTVRYEPVTFREPDEILLLPVRIENMTVIRNSGVPRLRTTRTFTNYRRFLTESRLIATK